MKTTPPPLQHYCANCYFPLPTGATYCTECRQKHTNGKIPVWTFVNEFFSEHLNLDSKIFRTIFALFIPGKLTEEYFKGRHRKFASPLRLFLVMAVLLFATVSFFTSNVDIGDDNIAYSRRAERYRIINMLDTIRSQRGAEFKNRRVSAALDSVYHDFEATIGNLSDSITLSVNINEMQPLVVTTKDFLELTPDEILDKYVVAETTTFHRFLMRQQVKVRQDGKGVFHFFIGKLSILVLLLMPFLALIMKILYVRRDYFYVEHLVFSFHYHAFAFLIIMFIIVVGKYINGLTLAAAILIPFIYQFLAMRRVYKQGYMKTFFKFSLLTFCYLFLIIFFFAFGVLISVALF